MNTTTTYQLSAASAEEQLSGISIKKIQSKKAELFITLY